MNSKRRHTFKLLKTDLEISEKKQNRANFFVKKPSYFNG